MPFTFLIDGLKIVADSPAEAASLLKSLRPDAMKATSSAPAVAPAPARKAWAHPVQSQAPAPQAPLQLEAPVGGTTPIHLTAAFLSVLRKASPGSVSSATMQETLLAEHPKGIGSKTAIVNSELRKFAANIHNVYSTERTPVGRIWTAGPLIDEVIDSVQEVLAAHAE